MKTLLVRHGHCLHNQRDAEGARVGEALYEHGNDDILGLTLRGVEETVELASKVAAHLKSTGGFPHHIEVVRSPSVRTHQTASLLKSTLVRKHGCTSAFFDDSVNQLLREIPSDDPIHSDVPRNFLLDSTTRLDYDKFAVDPDYVWWGTSYRTELTNRLGMHRSFQPSILGCQQLVVGHHYSIGALMCSFAVTKLKLRLTDRIVSFFHNLYIEHGRLYLLEDIIDPDLDPIGLMRLLNEEIPSS